MNVVFFVVILNILMNATFKAILFDPQKPFMVALHTLNASSSGSSSVSSDNSFVDYTLMTECLTALFRLDIKGTFETLVPVCLQDSAPSGFKLTFVRSCFNLAKEVRLLFRFGKVSLNTFIVPGFHNLVLYHV
jgi:hypothetical protein